MISDFFWLLVVVWNYTMLVFYFGLVTVRSLFALRAPNDAIESERLDEETWRPLIQSTDSGGAASGGESAVVPPIIPLRRDDLPAITRHTDRLIQVLFEICLTMVMLVDVFLW